MEPKYAALVQYRMETSLLPYWSLYPVSSHSWVAFSYLSMQYKCFPMHYIYQGIFKKDSCHPTTTFKFRQWCPAIQVASDWSYWILNPNKDVALASCHLRADQRMMKPYHGLWQRLLSSHQNNHKRASEELSHVNAKSATILSSFSVKDIHSSCVRIPFHQFAPNQVTKSRAQEMGRNSGIIPREFLFLVWLGTFRFRLWSKTSNWQMVFQM